MSHDDSLFRELDAQVYAEDFRGISAELALRCFDLPETRIARLFPYANHLRERFKGDWVKLCGIVNAKSGRCPERCDFCAQSAHFETQSPEYPLMAEEVILQRAREAKEKGVREFSIVASGTTMDDDQELEIVANAVRRIKEELGMEPCVSLGLLDDAQLAKLRAAGLVNVHHNLETARSHHSTIVKTHSFDEEMQAVIRAKAAGFQTCTGGIMGMGESNAQRVELALTLKEMGVTHIPVNFLSPIEGTPLFGKVDKLTPLECLRILAVYRMMMPDRDVFCMGGREVNLRELQSMIFFAGANGMMVGGYLTTSGRNHHTDLHMIRDLGLKVMACSAGAEHAASTASAASASAGGEPAEASAPVSRGRLAVLPS